MTRHVPLLLPLLLAMLLAPPARAQYIYLDSNGDGVHTEADVLHGIGPTVVDIWLDTTHNRDGSPTTCSSDASVPLTIFSYVVDVTAVGGHVGYASYTNRVEDMGPVGFAYPPDSTNFSTGAFFTPTSLVLPAGKYHLGTLIVQPGSGTPSLEIVPGTDPRVFFDMTEFGSTCPGGAFANTIAFGSDWTDADGLPFSAGGTPDQGPHLTLPQSMSVNAGDAAVQPIAATDADGQPLTFAKVAGPSFLYVTTTHQGAGEARGEVRAAPFLSDLGTYTVSVRVSDSGSSDEGVFNLAVTQGPDHPPFTPPVARLRVTAGQVSRVFLNGADPDGAAVHFARIDGPGYVELRELAGRPGGASAVMSLHPSLCDVGTATATFSVSDGTSSVRRDVAITVSAAVTDTTIRHNAAGFVNALTFADVDGDGALDIVAVHEDRSLISYYHGTGTGDFIFTNAYDVSGQNGGLASGDFDGDGRVDLAVTDPADGLLDVLLGLGDGSFRSRASYDTGSGPSGVAVYDFNRDGHPDLVTNNQEAGTVSVFIGVGDGTFARMRDSRVGLRPTAMAVGDFNLDGRPDVALAGPIPDAVDGFLTVLPGLGDGSFGDAIQTRFTGYPSALVSGDWDQDGRPDLALTSISSPANVQTFRGRGDGTFESGHTVASAGPNSFLFTMVTGDMDGDGTADLVVSDIQSIRLILLRGDGHGGFGGPSYFQNRYAASLAIGDVNGDGRPDLAGSGPNLVDVFMNPLPVVESVEAKAFVQGGRRGVLRGQDLCVRIQVQQTDDRGHSSREPLLVDPATIVLRSEGTGSVSEIHAITPRVVHVADPNADGIPDVDACFAAQDLAALFDALTHSTRVTPTIEGALFDGRGFCTDLDLMAGGQTQDGPHAVVFAPNPLNPVSRLTFATSREGLARVKIFDIHGRLTRTLLDLPRLPAGSHEYVFDGKGDHGEKLPSGVYYYRVLTTEGRFDGRILILK